MFKNLVLALLAVGLAGVAVWFLSDRSNGGVERGLDPKHAADAATGRRTAELGKEPLDAVELNGERQAVGLESEPAAHQAKARAVTSLQGAARALLVIDPGTNEPVAGADVFQCAPRWFRDATGKPLARLIDVTRLIASEGFEVTAEALEHAPYFQTDARGQVWLQDTARETLVIVQAGPRRGFGIVGGRFDTGATLEVVLPKTLTVRTVDANGAVVPNVQFGMQGVASIAGLGERQTNQSGLWVRHEVNTMVEPINQLTAVLGPPEVRFGSWSAFPSEWQALDLRVGGTFDLVVGGGQVVVRLVDAAGQPIDAPGTKIFLSGDGRTLNQALSEGSTVSFTGLTVGVEVTATMANSTLRTIALPEPVAGVVGVEPLQLTLVSDGQREFELRLRVMDGSRDGAPVPLRSAAVVLQQRLLMGASSRKSDVDIKTDSEGFAAFDFTSNWGVLSSDQVFELVVSHTSETGTLRSVAVELEGPLTLPYDFGELVLYPQKPFVAGMVWSADGTPVEDAHVKLFYRDNQQLNNEFDVEGFVFTNPQGRFESFGASTNTGWVLFASHPEFGQSAIVPFEPGQQDIRVQLIDAGAIAMSLAQEDQARAADYMVWLRSEEAGFEQEFSPRASGSGDSRRNSLDGFGTGFDARGRLIWERLLPGSYSIKIDKAGVEFLSVDHVRVHSNEITRDPRLTDIRLGANLQRIELEVLDAAGTPIEGVQVEALETAERLAITGGVLVVPEMGREVLVSAAGFMTERILLDQAFESVMLRAAPTVTLRFPFALEDTDAIAFEVQLAAEELNRRHRPGARNSRRPQGDLVVVPVEAFGKQQVIVLVTRSLGEGMRIQDAVKLEWSLDLNEDSEGQVIEVAVTDAERVRLE